MPANLTHKYIAAEKAYRNASSPQEELECLLEMLREIPKHKGTDKLQAELKKKISQAKEVAANPKQNSRRSLRIPRQGAGRAVILGAANSGKSQLLAGTTNAQPAVDIYPFTTTQSTPGMMTWEDVSIQLVDTPARVG